MKPKTYDILSRCIEDGIRLGVQRAHKHTETPTHDQIVEASYQAAMSEICDWFSFEDELGEKP
jgi:hypothetical protein